MNSVKEDIDQKGFVVLRDLFANNELEEVRRLCTKIHTHFSSNNDDDLGFRKFFLKHRVDQGVLYDLYFRHPEFRFFIRNERLIDHLKSILGENIIMYENSLVYKPQGKDNEVPWHQDFLNRPDESQKFIVWIAFDKITKENGSLKIISSSHKKGLRPFHTFPGETHHTRLNLDGVDTSSYEYVEMNPGDTLIFNQHVIHGSDRVSSPLPRRAYRFSVQNFEQIFSPRCVPVVLSGGIPGNYNAGEYEKGSIKGIKKKDFFLKRVYDKLLR